MSEENKVVLHGMWSSPFVKRVELALKLKRIPYEYVEEDLKNKSPLLLKYNPVYKKVPVLVHNGKPIVESLIIIEYIDETWKDRGPKLLPDDPYRRAKVRFWINYMQQQVFEAVSLVIKTEGEAQEKAIKEVLEKVIVLEEGMRDIFSDGIPTVNSENFGLLEMVMCSLFSPYKAQEEVLGYKALDQEKTPFLLSWIEAINEQPAVKELLPPHEKLVALFQFLRQNALKPTA